MKKFKVGVKVMPREAILDTQGRAVEQILQRNNFHLQQCRVGRFVELTLDGDQNQAMREAKKIAEFVLANPLIENFELIALGDVE